MNKKPVKKSDAKKALVTMMDYIAKRQIKAAALQKEVDRLLKVKYDYGNIEEIKNDFVAMEKKIEKERQVLSSPLHELKKENDDLFNPKKKAIETQRKKYTALYAKEWQRKQEAARRAQEEIDRKAAEAEAERQAALMELESKGAVQDIPEELLTPVEAPTVKIEVRNKGVLRKSYNVNSIDEEMFFAKLRDPGLTEDQYNTRIGFLAIDVQAIRNYMKAHESKVTEAFLKSIGIDAEYIGLED